VTDETGGGAENFGDEQIAFGKEKY